MAGFGYSGQQALYSPAKRPGKASGTTAQNFKNYSAIPQTTAMPTAISQQMDYLKDIPTGLTPEQELAERNRIRSTDNAQMGAGTDRVRELMAAQGLSGSGAETSNIMNLMRNQANTRQGALSNLGIEQARMGLANQYNKAGLMNSLTGMGENARQFDLGQAGNMYQYGTSFDEDSRRYKQQRSDYQKQLEEWLNQLNLGSGRG